MRRIITKKDEEAKASKRVLREHETDKVFVFLVILLLSQDDTFLGITSRQGR